jgi:hypothetical protein
MNVDFNNLVYSTKTPQVGDKCLLIQTGNNKYCIPLTNESTSTSASTSEIISAFEVMPNKVDIPKNTAIVYKDNEWKVYEPEEDDNTTLTYTNKILACTVHKMTLRSAQEPEDCDVVIDWGDGVVESIKDGHYVSHIKGKSYELSHDYSTNMTSDVQRFIIKIYGKDYYTFRHDLYKDNNLISRIFDTDLPIAGFVTNFASMVFGASRILCVKFPHSTEPFTDVYNWSNCFNECSNIVSITGFEDISLRGDAIYNNFMAACGNLTTTDFVIPASITSIPNIFTGDINLECDINNLIPAQGFASSNIFISSPFRNLSKMDGTVPADKLWGDEHINWIFKSTTNRPFMNCSTEIREQVPVSWGGTNKILDVELKLKQLKVNTNEYSAFEVMPNKVDIPAGTAIVYNKTNNEWNVVFPDNGDTALTFSSDIAACTVHKMTLRSAQEPEECDVVIDWGDGTVETIKDGNYTGHTIGKAYELEHDYASTMTSDVQRFIIKIYGKDYYTFRHNLYKDNNLISRIFDVDLPIASHVTNFASLAIYSQRLLKVHIPHSTSPYVNVWNWGSALSMCYNLVEVTGFEDISFCPDSKLASLFGNTNNLITTDFSFNSGTDNLTNTFLCCSKLEANISNILPKNGFSTPQIKVGAVFYNCEKLTGTVPGEILWNDKSKVWLNTSDAFIGCSDEIRKQVPKSWGGTASDDIIKHRPVDGYLRKVITDSIIVQSGYWYICTTSGLTLTLPKGNIEDYIRFSTNYLATNVVIKPVDGETIDGDSEGFTLDKTSSTVEMLWTGSEWTVIEAK